MRPCSVETHRQQAAEHVPPHKGTCRCRRSRQLHRKAHLYEYILCSLQPCQSQHSNHIERQLHAQRLTHTHTRTHTHTHNPYLHVQTQIQLGQGHGCQSIISLIFHRLSPPLQLHTSHPARVRVCLCVKLCVCVCVCWHRLLAVYSEHLHLMCSEHPSLSHTLTHTHTHTPCFVIDRLYFCRPERLRHSGVKGCSLPLSFFLHPSSPAPLLICLRPSSSSAVCVYVCVCLCVFVQVCECVNACLVQLPAFHWNVI